MPFSLSQVEADLTQALKARDQVVTETLRGLKVRIQNERISKVRELSEDELLSLVKSEIKRRREAAEAFTAGGRPEAADREQREAEVLSRYLPPQLSEAELAGLVDKLVTEKGYATKDFGAAMGELRNRVGQQADGAALARILKARLG